MDLHKIFAIMLVVGLTIISGFGDAQGFIHASGIWNSGKVVWSEVVRSALGFTLGISMYWICIRFIQDLNIISPEIQTIFWFSITIIGVATFNGEFSQWQRVDQFVGLIVLLGLAWLMIRVGR